VLALSLASPGSLLKLFFQYYRARGRIVAGRAHRPCCNQGKRGNDDSRDRLRESSWSSITTAEATTEVSP
jgi:hypothetical protein